MSINTINPFCVYYAHNMKSYQSKQERDDLSFLHDHFPEFQIMNQLHLAHVFYQFFPQHYPLDWKDIVVRYSGTIVAYRGREKEVIIPVLLALREGIPVYSLSYHKWLEDCPQEKSIINHWMERQENKQEYQALLDEIVHARSLPPRTLTQRIFGEKLPYSSECLPLIQAIQQRERQYSLSHWRNQSQKPVHVSISPIQDEGFSKVMYCLDDEIHILEEVVSEYGNLRNYPHIRIQVYDDYYVTKEAFISN